MSVKCKIFEVRSISGAFCAHASRSVRAGWATEPFGQARGDPPNLEPQPTDRGWGREREQDASDHSFYSHACSGGLGQEAQVTPVASDEVHMHFF